MKKVSLVLLAVLLMLTSCLAACSTTKQVLVSDGYSDYVFQDGEEPDDNSNDADKEDDNDTSSKKNNTSSKKNNTSSKNNGTVSKNNGTASKNNGTTGGDSTGKATTVTVAFNSFRPTDLEPMLAEFQKTHKDIKIKVDYYNSASDNSKEYIANKSAAGKLPDVVFDDVAQLSLYVSQGIVHPLTKFVKDDKDFSYVPSYFIENYTYLGDLYALPHQAYFTSIAFNLDLLDSLNLDMPALDWSINDFVALVKKAYKGGQNYAIDDDNFLESYFAAALSKNASNYGYIEKERTFDTDALVEALKIQGELRKIPGAVGYKARFGTSQGASDYMTLVGSEDFHAAFKNGKSVMLDLYYGTYNYSYVEELASGFDWCFWTYPQGTKGSMPVHVDHAWMTTAAASKADAAFEVIRFLTYSKEGNLARLNAYINAKNGKYKLNLPYYTPTTLHPDVKAAYLKLMKQNSGNSKTFEAANYEYENLGKCFRGDCDKYTPSFSQSWLDNATATVNKMRDSGDYSGAAALKKKATSAIQSYWNDFETKLAKVKKDNKNMY